MVGRLDRNLRQGHRAELQGVDLLRPFCAVAPVPQTEDVGFDAVATLLRTDGRFFYAEDSFCVQFKARSVREIELKPHEYTWFHALSMPLFIGSVDVATSEAELFTTHFLAGHLNARDCKSAIIYLDDRPNSFDGDRMCLSLGAPILRWTPRQAEDPEFQSLAYNILKQWNTTEYVNIGLRHIRTKRQVFQWKTNEVPSPGRMMAAGGTLVQDLEAAVPYLTKIAMHLLVREEDAGVRLEVLGFYFLLNWIHEQNVPGIKALVQMTGHKLGVYRNEFRLELKLETTKSGESGDQAVDAS